MTLTAALLAAGCVPRLTNPKGRNAQGDEMIRYYWHPEVGRKQIECGDNPTPCFLAEAVHEEEMAARDAFEAGEIEKRTSTDRRLRRGGWVPLNEAIALGMCGPGGSRI